ncbi:MAG: tripartite tricarboxylate transporter substrate-binding protein, partial [Pseudomonadota bacterium]
MRRVILNIMAVTSVLLATNGLAIAQSDYPSRLIRIVVAWPPGSSIDVVVRLMAEPLRAELGQSVVIDNRAGAGGVIGAEIVAVAPPDGYTLLYTSAGLNMVAAMGTQTSYKVPDSFTPVVNVNWTPLILLAHPSLRVKTPQELIALAKARPGQLVYATAGQGSPSHFATELLRVRTGFEATGVPYRGSPQALLDVIAGRAAFLFTPASTALPQVRAGKITALAVGSNKRLEIAPEIPTLEESGYKGIRASFWNGLLGPKGLPQPIANRFATAVNRVLARPDVQTALAPAGNETDGKSDPQSFAAMMKEDMATWVEVARAADIKPN